MSCVESDMAEGPFWSHASFSRLSWKLDEVTSREALSQCPAHSRGLSLGSRYRHRDRCFCEFTGTVVVCLMIPGGWRTSTMVKWKFSPESQVHSVNNILAGVPAKCYHPPASSKFGGVAAAEPRMERKAVFPHPHTWLRAHGEAVQAKATRKGESV